MRIRINKGVLEIDEDKYQFKTISMSKEAPMWDIELLDGNHLILTFEEKKP